MSYRSAYPSPLYPAHLMNSAILLSVVAASPSLLPRFNPYIYVWYYYFMFDWHMYALAHLHAFLFYIFLSHPPCIWRIELYNCNAKHTLCSTHDTLISPPYALLQHTTYLRSTYKILLFVFPSTHPGGSFGYQ